MAAKTSNKSNSVSSLKPLGALLSRFHFLIFFIVVVGCLAASVYYINYTFTHLPEDGYTSTINPGTIDQKALERIQNLHTSSQPASAPELPNGRVNPLPNKHCSVRNEKLILKICYCLVHAS